MKDRNKKILGAVTFGVVVPTAANYITFNMLKGPLATDLNQYIYNSKYGKIRFIKKGRGKPVLLIHSLTSGGNLSEFNKQIELLSRDYRVYALDLLGYGNSDRPALSYSSYLYTELINDFIDDVIKEPTYIIASSESSVFAVMAREFNPENIEKLLLISPYGLEDNSCRVKYGIGKFLGGLHFGTTFYNIFHSLPGLLYYLNKYVYSNKANITPKVIRNYHLSSHMGGINTKYPLIAKLKGYFNLDIRKQLLNTNIPVHIVWGADNKLNPIDEISCIDELSEKFGISIFEKSKLFPHDENPYAFADIAKEFFQ